MNKITNYIEQFSKNVGLNITTGSSVSLDKVSISKSVQKQTHAVFAKIMRESVIIVLYEGHNQIQLSKLTKALYEQFTLYPVVLAAQLTSAKRSFLLDKQMPFITLDGDVFLPFMNTKLFATFGTNPSITQFSPISQRLIILILNAQILLERQGGHALTEMFDGVFSISNGLFEMNSGQKFVDRIGVDFEINNRVSFNRAIKELLEMGIVKAHGETRSRTYTCEFDSWKLFQLVRNRMMSPILKTKNEYFHFYEPREVRQFQFLYGGLSALSTATMIADDDTKTLVFDRDEWRRASAFSELSTDSNEMYKVELSAYSLVAFAKLFRRISPHYPEDIIDPFHLMAIFKNNPDERIAGEVEDLIDKVWEDKNR